jgi:hypothetical protein
VLLPDVAPTSTSLPSVNDAWFAIVVSCEFDGPIRADVGIKVVAVMLAVVAIVVALAIIVAVVVVINGAEDGAGSVVGGAVNVHSVRRKLPPLAVGFATIALPPPRTI